MHGTIFHVLKKYVDTNLGNEAWGKLVNKAGLAGKEYDPLKAYPDEEVLALVTTASEITGTPIPAILDSFGEFIVPDLLQMFWAAVDPSWKTLDLLERTEQTIHQVVRVERPGATPPELVVTRPSDNEAVITYKSPRKMCALAKGVARGVAKHFNEEVVISESKCMNNGDAECCISVKLAN